MAPLVARTNAPAPTPMYTYVIVLFAVLDCELLLCWFVVMTIVTVVFLPWPGLDNRDPLQAGKKQSTASVFGTSIGCPNSSLGRINSLFNDWRCFKLIMEMMSIFFSRNSSTVGLDLHVLIGFVSTCASSPFQKTELLIVFVEQFRVCLNNFENRN